MFFKKIVLLLWLACGAHTMLIWPSPGQATSITRKRRARPRKRKPVARNRPRKAPNRLRKGLQYGFVLVIVGGIAVGLFALSKRRHMPDPLPAYGPYPAPDTNEQARVKKIIQTASNLPTAIQDLILEWLPTNNYEPRKMRVFIRRRAHYVIRTPTGKVLRRESLDFETEPHPYDPARKNRYVLFEAVTPGIYRIYLEGGGYHREVNVGLLPQAHYAAYLQERQEHSPDKEQVCIYTGSHPLMRTKQPFFADLGAGSLIINDAYYVLLISKRQDPNQNPFFSGLTSPSVHRINPGPGGSDGCSLLVGTDQPFKQEGGLALFVG